MRFGRECVCGVECVFVVVVVVGGGGGGVTGGGGWGGGGGGVGGDSCSRCYLLLCVWRLDIQIIHLSLNDSEESRPVTKLFGPYEKRLWYCKFQTKHNLDIDIFSVQANIILEWTLEVFYDVKSILVEVMAWCPDYIAINFISVDQDIRRHMTSLGYNELINFTVAIFSLSWYITLILIFSGSSFPDEISHGYPRNNCYITKSFILCSTYEGPTQQQRFVGFS